MSSWKKNSLRHVLLERRGGKKIFFFFFSNMYTPAAMEIYMRKKFKREKIIRRALWTMMTDTIHYGICTKSQGVEKIFFSLFFFFRFPILFFFFFYFVYFEKKIIGSYVCIAYDTSRYAEFALAGQYSFIFYQRFSFWFFPILCMWMKSKGFFFEGCSIRRYGQAMEGWKMMKIRTEAWLLSYTKIKTVRMLKFLINIFNELV